MPLPTPILDDRSYQQLRDELVRRIPVYTKEWTDHNPSDPGITLLELLAFLGENLLFRFNQIPEATRLAFLKLLDVPLRPPVPARALVAFTRTDTGLAPILVPKGTETLAGKTPFETLTEVSVHPLEAVALGRLRVTKPSTGELGDFSDAALDALRNAGRLGASEEAAFYENRLVPDDPSRPDATPVDLRKTVDGALWIAILKTAATDPTKLGKAILNVGFVPDPEVPTIDQVPPCPGPTPSDGGPEMIWEVSTPVIAAGEARYKGLAVEGDTTRGLSQEGVVRLRLPASAADFGLPVPADADLRGAGSFPPVLDDEALDARVLFWIRGTRRREARPLGSALHVALHAAEVVQTRTAGAELLGVGTGEADQTYTLVHKPVVAGSVALQVEEDGRWVDWDAVDGFESSAEDARHYVVDLEAGSVRFGNVKGRPPQIGERIRVTSYRYGGGAEGNVGAKAISKVTGVSDVKAENRLPARGGAAAESVREALTRVPAEIRRRDRAVTPGDFEELALATPGAGVGRAECLPLFHPPTKKRDAAGVVSVVVWPREDPKHPNAPLPDRTLLREVCEYLDARRLVTTELYVIPPTYRKVAVAVGLAAKKGYGIEAVRRWVELVLRQYLAPLPPYGPEGRGWPLGRRVYGPELEAAALQVEGVEFLEGLDVAAWNESTKTWVPFVGKPVPLAPWEVPELVEITVVEGKPLKPGDALGPVKPPKLPVPVPTLVEEC